MLVARRSVSLLLHLAFKNRKQHAIDFEIFVEILEGKTRGFRKKL
jgi:hypothetical protein